MRLPSGDQVGVLSTSGLSVRRVMSASAAPVSSMLSCANVVAEAKATIIVASARLANSVTMCEKRGFLSPLSSSLSSILSFT